MSKRSYKYSSTFYRRKNKYLNSKDDEDIEDIRPPNESTEPGPSVSFETETHSEINFQHQLEINLTQNIDPNLLGDIYEDEREFDLVDHELEFTEKLKIWAIEGQVTHTTLNKLLKLLKSHGHESLPLDSRTLLSTPRKIELQEMGTGSFWYAGIESCIVRSFDNRQVRVIQFKKSCVCQLNILCVCAHLLKNIYLMRIRYFQN